MKKYFRTSVLVFISATLMLGVPCIKTPSDCGLTLTHAFTGTIFGCGGEKEPAQQTDVFKKTAAAAGTENKTGLKVTFVELGSVNCIPCRMMKPVMEKIEKQYPGQVRVVFHDIWTEEGKAAGYKFAVRVIPTQVFLDNNEKEYFRHEGFLPFEEVDKILKQKGVN